MTEEIVMPITAPINSGMDWIEEIPEEKENYYKIDPFQRIVWKYIRVRKSGCIIGVTGRPNVGKSWTGNKIILDWDRQPVEKYLTYDVPNIFQKTFENIYINGKVMSQEEFEKIPNIKEWCKENIKSIKVKPGGSILVDEAGTSVYNRNFFSAENKAMSKLVQVWRFMRMLVIFVVPERFDYLEKTLREFFDVKVIMTGKDEENGYSKAIVYERFGRNYKGEPTFKRVTGCRHGGFIKVFPFSNKYPQEAADYERLAAIYKVSVMMESRGDVSDSDDKKEKKTNSIEEYMEKARAIRDSLKDYDRRAKRHPIPRYSIDLIQNQLQIGSPLAKRIRSQLELEEHMGIQQ